MLSNQFDRNAALLCSNMRGVEALKNRQIHIDIPSRPRQSPSRRPYRAQELYATNALLVIHQTYQKIFISKITEVQITKVDPRTTVLNMTATLGCKSSKSRFYRFSHSYPRKNAPFTDYDLRSVDILTFDHFRASPNPATLHTLRQTTSDIHRTTSGHHVFISTLTTYPFRPL